MFSAIVRGCVFASLCGFMASSARAGDEYLMIPDLSNHRVLLVDPFDGHIVDYNFIVNPPEETLLWWPKAAVQVDNEIWVSEQAFGAVLRYTADLRPRFLGYAAWNLERPTGMCAIDNKVLIAHSARSAASEVLCFTNAGPCGLAFRAEDPYDIIEFGNGLLVTDYAASRVLRYSLEGTGGSDFVATGDANFTHPQQVALLQTGPQGQTRLWVAAIGGAAGYYEFDMQGNQTRYLPLGNASGMVLLGNGRLLVTGGWGIEMFNLEDESHTLVEDYEAEYIKPLNLCRVGCLADANRDGSVDGADVEAFFLRWQSGESCGDVNNDGSVDGSDVETFFSRWVSGGC